MASDNPNSQPSTAAIQDSSYDYELLVIGGGSGGLVAAKQAAKAGIKVGLVEADEVGGTCANRGCVPKKLMHYAAEFSHQKTLAQSYGWPESKKGAFHWETFQTKLQEQLENIRSSISDSVTEAGIELIRGRAQFIDQHQLSIQRIADGAEHYSVSAERIIIAVGGQPMKLDIPGMDIALTSRDLFKLEKLPQSMIIVGGGYIGVEFSGILSTMGVSVTLMDTDATPLQHFDQALREGVLKNLQEQGVKFVANASLESIRSASEAGLEMAIASFSSTLEEDSSQQEVKAEQILVATGRTPNLAPLNLEAAGVKVEKGAIVVDDHYQTSQSNIYALGDCIDRLPLTPVAQAEARCVIDHLYGEGIATVDYRWSPCAVYAMPPAASVGWTEEQAKEKVDNVICHRKEVTPLSHVLSQTTPHSQLKWIVDGDSDQILGLHVLSVSAPDIVQSITPLLQRGICHHELQQAMGIHPTFGEELFDT